MSDKLITLPFLLPISPPRPPPLDQRRCLARCGAKLGGESENGTASGKWIDRRQLYIVNFTCGDTVWTAGHYKRYGSPLAAFTDVKMIPSDLLIGSSHDRIVSFLFLLALPDLIPIPACPPPPSPPSDV